MLYCVRRTPIVVCFKSARHVTLIKHSLEYLVTTCIITSLYTAHQRWAETFGGFDEQIFPIKAAGFKKDEDYMVLLWNLFLLSLLLCILASGVIETNLSEHSVREERFFMNPSSSSGEYFLVFRLAKVKEADTHFCRWLSGLG